jgi:hypothetical protein
MTGVHPQLPEHHTGTQTVSSHLASRVAILEGKLLVAHDDERDRIVRHLVNQLRDVKGGLSSTFAGWLNDVASNKHRENN